MRKFLQLLVVKCPLSRLSLTFPLVRNAMGEKAPTNVSRLSSAVAHKCCTGKPQIVYYHPGAGTETSKVARFLGGAFGMGVEQVRMPQTLVPVSTLALERPDRTYIFSTSSKRTISSATTITPATR